MSDEVTEPASLDDTLTEAVAAGRMLIARCGRCGHSFWHPRSHCPRCGARDVALVAPSGPARVYTATVNHRPRGGGADGEPVQMGYIEFPEGVRILVTLRFPDGKPGIGTEVALVEGGESAGLVFGPVSRTAAPSGLDAVSTGAGSGSATS